MRLADQSLLIPRSSLNCISNIRTAVVQAGRASHIGLITGIIPRRGKKIREGTPAGEKFAARTRFCRRRSCKEIRVLSLSSYAARIAAVSLDGERTSGAANLTGESGRINFSASASRNNAPLGHCRRYVKMEAITYIPRYGDSRKRRS